MSIDQLPRGYLDAKIGPLSPVFNYIVDAAQRSVLYLDVMRQRGNQYRAHMHETVPHVLDYDAELVVDGRTLERPINYALARIRPPDSVKIKGIKSPVAGRAQIVVVPDLEAGNMLAKNLIFLLKEDSAGIVRGARVPIIRTSCADTVRSRMASCAAAVLYADARRRAAVVPAA